MVKRCRYFGGSSPHTRGALVSSNSGISRFRIIPAYAGSTRGSSTRADGWRDHPRIRGEHQHLRVPAQLEHGSSPHTRGALQALEARNQDIGIIPAYAGSTTSSPPPAHGHGDHPRIRGEHPDAERHQPKGNGSSPHTRGAHQERFQHGQRWRIIPAYAGSTPNS